MLNKIWIPVLLMSGWLTACGSSENPSDGDSSSSTPNPNPSPGNGSSLIISEIVAKSDDGTYLAGNDWIELYNAGSEAVNLSNYALADSGSDIIALPDIGVGAGQYIVIAAVDSEDANPPSPSVPFKLGKEDSVTLYYDGQALETTAWADGDAPGGASYGLLDGVAQTTEPTPGEGNRARIVSPGNNEARGNPSGNSDLKISEVVAKSDRPSFYDESDWIEIVNTGSGPIDLADYTLGDDSNDLESLPPVTLQPGEYYVVLAGGDPPTDDSAYVTFGLGSEDSVSLFRGSEEVDYIGWADGDNKKGRSRGRIDGEEQTLYPTPGYENVSYVLFTEEEVYTVRVDIPQADWQAILADPQAEQYYPANFELNGGVIENVGFRVKGQGSLMSIQNSKRYGFKVDMNEYEDQKFMGMKKLVFNGSFSDPTMMRDVLAYKLMREAGVPAPETSYVDLWVSGEHMGLYQMIEMVDSEFVEKHFPEDEDDKGDLYKGEIGQRFTWIDDNYSSYSSGIRLKTNPETEGTPEEGAPLIELLDGINNGNDPLAHIDTDIMVKYLAALVLTGNMDSPIGATANNFYLYEERFNGTFTILPWDFNLAYGMWGDGPASTIGPIGGGFGGGFDGGGFGGGFEGGGFEGGGFGGGFEGGGFGGGAPAGEGCQVVDHVIDNPVHDTNSVRPMFDPILQTPELKAEYHSTLQNLLDTAYNPEYLESEIMRLADLIDPYVQADPTKFFTYQEWRSSLTQDMPEGSDISAGRGAGIYGPAPGLLNFIREKASSVQRQLNGEIPSSNGGGTACPPTNQ